MLKQTVTTCDTISEANWVATIRGAFMPCPVGSHAGIARDCDNSRGRAERVARMRREAPVMQSGEMLISRPDLAKSLSQHQESGRTAAHVKSGGHARALLLVLNDSEPASPHGARSAERAAASGAC